MVIELFVVSNERLVRVLASVHHSLFRDFKKCFPLTLDFNGGMPTLLETACNL